MLFRLFVHLSTYCVCRRLTRLLPRNAASERESERVSHESASALVQRFSFMFSIIQRPQIVEYDAQA